MTSGTGTGAWAQFLNRLSSKHKPQRIDAAQHFSASNSRMPDNRPRSIGEAPPFAYAYDSSIRDISLSIEI